MIVAEVRSKVKIYRFVGINGRTTIPFVIRKIANLKNGSLISYKLQDDNSIIIRAEEICPHSDEICMNDDIVTVDDFINSLNDDEQKKILCQLAMKILGNGVK